MVEKKKSFVYLPRVPVIQWEGRVGTFWVTVPV